MVCLFYLFLFLLAASCSLSFLLQPIPLFLLFLIVLPCLPLPLRTHHFLSSLPFASSFPSLVVMGTLSSSFSSLLFFHAFRPVTYSSSRFPLPLVFSLVMGTVSSSSSYSSLPSCLPLALKTHHLLILSLPLRPVFPRVLLLIFTCLSSLSISLSLSLVLSLLSPLPFFLHAYRCPSRLTISSSLRFPLSPVFSFSLSWASSSFLSPFLSSLMLSYAP